MLKRNILLCTLTGLIAAVSSCIFDPDPGKKPPCEGCNQEYQDLTERWHVLNNLELAYTRRHINQYNRILDANFTFFLTPGDVGGGLPENWGRADELKYNTDLLNAQLDENSPFPRCKSIQMDVQWEKGLQWVEITPGSAPDETWYTATVFYDFKFEMEPDNTYINNPGAKGQFTVRDAGPFEGKPSHWQLVEFRDLGGAP